MSDAISDVAAANGAPVLGGERDLATPAAAVAHQLSRTWEAAGAIHRLASPHEGTPALRERVRELIGELFVLTDCLVTGRRIAGAGADDSEGRVISYG